MAKLSRAQILELHRTAIAAKLARKREALLEAFDPAFVDTFEKLDNDSSQLLYDLERLNATPQLPDGAMPLVVWIENALALAGPLPQAEVLRALLAVASCVEPAAGEAQRSPPALQAGLRIETEDAREVRLQQANARKRRLEENGADTREVDQEILELRRALRRGGQLHAGDLFGAGRYLLLTRLGKGGFGVVWRARDQTRGCDVAIKVLHPELASDRIRRDRFFRGARMMAELSHPAVVRVLEPHGFDDGFWFYVMELLEGGDFRRAVLEGRLKGEAAIAALLEIGAALAEAHAKRWIHRDVKPANILLDGTGRPRLTDFDLVAAAETTGGTQTGALGTLLYAAPELLERPQDADARADVYGLAMTALFALLGRDVPRTILRDADEVIDALDAPSAMKSLLKRALDWEPANRHADASELCCALALVAAAKASASKPPAWTNQGEDPFGRWAEADIAGVSVRFRRIAPGAFLMGSPDDDGEAFDDEKPRHRVTIAQGFWIAETPCTQMMWTAVMGKNPSAFKGEHLPVERVSFEDVETLLARLNGARDDELFRLPTEAEWEYSSRAGTEAARYGELDAIAWHLGNSVGVTHPVGQKAPNAWGLFDMLGNVWEWCSDELRAYGGKPLGAEAQAGTLRVVRGGSGLGRARGVRAACRDAYHPSFRGLNLGVRLVRDLP